ncbi:MAG: NADH-quinone oxidoreductase subunit H [Candidatus Saganbacteria bacterium]|nr:NADH-quinone oxidoreductase subunit H [Candidatus Saganbacteria bacterium]
MEIIFKLFYLLIFPGFLFLVFYGLFLEWIDRKLLAKFQNRVGPPWFQPVADFIKLFAKEDTVPAKADRAMFALAPVFALAAVLTTIAFIPVIVPALYSFPGDIVVIAYLLMVPTFGLFLGGWYSANYFASIGAVRTTLLLFSYEVPLLMALLGPAILAGSWSIEGVIAFQAAHPWIILYQPLGFIVVLVSIVGKLERIPFDIPEAETEIVEGPLCEYSGKKLALYRLMFDVETVIGASLISIFYLGGFYGANILLTAAIFLVKTLVVLFMISLAKAVFGRIRIDQMIEFCWKILMPTAILQFLLIIIARLW